MAAAAVVYHYFAGNVDMIPSSYNQEPDFTNCADREVYVVDFSFKKQVLKKLLGIAHKVILLDHHKTAFEELSLDPERAYEGGIFELGRTMTAHLDTNRSGAGITWDFFYGDNKRPLLVTLVEDRDLWRFTNELSEPFHTATPLYPFTVEDWRKLLLNDDTVRTMANNGKYLLAYHKSLLEKSMRATVCSAQLDGHETLACNLPPVFASEAGHILAEETKTMGVVWFTTPKGDVAVSLRSIGDFDVSAIAKKFGGGGHKHAAGFTIRKENRLDGPLRIF
jgi:nanoRNase/pAp phosphatase (c-di-AMP/oligoRNAs hydrolase)